MPPDTVPIDLTGLADDEFHAIETEARLQGITFDECCKRMLIDHSRQLQKAPQPGPLGWLFGFSAINQK